ncbi:uncharacterized protein LOC118185587 isoform X2 [Stegodyphus dumicola]|uniref:uncharacterized protein LOC118185587 isoform X2 n=1 Tax=Stegodyphus dumicola TaxID=202533 RepID=UPI0015AC7F4F|nr:uncharacterized protein LOC118185587 isoform X2 [Stegodyphus dumicola]
MFVFAFLLVTVFLSSVQYCESGSNELRKYSNSYVNQLLFEDCVRKELMKSHKTVKTGPVSQLSQYADMWVNCAESTGGEFEDSNLIFSPPLKFRIIQLWKKMGDLLDVSKKYGLDVSDECKKILLYRSIRACLPTIQAYSLRYREGDVIAFVPFVKCISSSLIPCGNETGKFFTSVIKRNVKYIFYLSDDKEEKLKECLEMVKEPEINDCAAGLYGLLSAIALGKIVFEPQVRFSSDFKCIHQAFKYCDSESVKIITSLVQDSMNVTLFNSKEILRRSSQPDVFTCMPDDVSQIQSCLTLSSLYEINECCPELACILEGIVKDTPVTELSFSINRQFSGCLGYALRKCSGSMRFVINKVMLGLYGIDLKIPFNRNSILSLPGYYEEQAFEILFPPYSVPAIILKEISICLQSDGYILEDCCGQLVDAIVKVLRDESLPFPFQKKRKCMQHCIKKSIYRCSEAARIWIEKLIFGIKEAYDKLSTLNVPYFSKTPPYALPTSIFQKLDSCIETINPNAIETCCPGILRVINAYKSNESLSLDCLIPKSCKYECLLHTTDACESKSAVLLQAFVAFAIKVYEEAQAPSNILLYQNRYAAALTEGKNLHFISHRSANNLSGSSTFSQIGTAQVFSSNPQGRIIFIPSFLSEQIRVCMYLMEKKLLDSCWEGMYDFMISISYGLRPSPLGPVHAQDIRLCLRSAFQPCYSSSVLVINNVLKPFVNGFDVIIPSRQKIVSMSRIDDASKASVKTCLKRIMAEKLDNFFEYVFDKIIEILESEQSKSKTIAGASRDNHLKEVFKVCSMKARLLISTIAFDHLGIILDIPLFYESAPINIMEMLPNDEMLELQTCLASQNEDEIDACEPGLSLILSQIAKGYATVFQQSLKLNRHCLENMFKHCSVRSRLLIMDVVKFATGIVIDIPLRLKNRIHRNIYEPEISAIESCIGKTVPNDVIDKCLPGYSYVMNEIYRGQVPDMSDIPPTIQNLTCLESTISSCSPDARMLITEILLNYTGNFVNFLFAASSERKIQSGMEKRVQGCFQTIEKITADNCIQGLYEALRMFSEGILPPPEHILKIQDTYKPTCIKDVFKNCIASDLILIDEFLRQINLHYVGSLVNEVLDAYAMDDAGVHEHSIVDQQYVQQCFKTLHQDNLDSCTPGLYNVIKDLAEDNLPLNIVALKTVEHNCLESNFAQCSYMSRLLIKDLIYDYARLDVVIPLLDAPEGFTGEFGPPIAAIQNCLSTIDFKNADKIMPGFLRAFHETFVRQVGNSGFKLLPEKAMSAMAYLKDLFISCEVPIKMYLLQKIAEINNIKLNVQIEKHSLQEKAPEVCFPYLLQADHLPEKPVELVVIINNSGIYNRDENDRFPREANSGTKDIKTLVHKDDVFGRKEISGGLSMSELSNRRSADSHTSNHSEIENAENPNSENSRHGTRKES